MPTINTMVKRIAGLQNTSDVNDWEDGFIASVVEQTNDGENTTSLSDRQVECVERIFNKHFSG